MDIWLSPELAEQVVEADLRRREDRGERRDVLRYRARADGIYDSLLPGERQEAFEKLHRALFEELGFCDPLRRGLEEFPELSHRLESLLLFPASRGGEEGVELGREAFRLGLRALPERFADPEGLKGFLRKALARASLLLSEPFGYRAEEDPRRRVPRAPSPVLGRYEALWGLAVEAELAARGYSEAGGRERAFEVFAAWFGVQGEGRGTLSERLWEVPGGLTHPDIVRFAQDPTALWERLGVAGAPGEGPRRGRVPGERCPLCQFPTHAWADPDEREEAGVVAAIREDFPGWAPEEGLCERCLEGYRARLALRPAAWGPAAVAAGGEVLKPSLSQEEGARWS